MLIETILATFEMDEILYELKDHSAGLNCGRWDYIFSFIKKFAGDKGILLPDRGQVTMTTHFMRSYSKLCIKTCHRRQVSAMGGMSAFIPIKSDPVANETALKQVRADKEREATDGHDGTWVAHPGLVPVALEVFDRVMPQPNQIDKQLPDYHATAADLLQVPTGTISEAGVRQNVAVGLGYVEAWLRGDWVCTLVQPDGGCGYGGDQPGAALAVGASWRGDGRWAAGDGEADRTGDCG